MSVTPMKSTISRADIETLSQLKVPVSPSQNPRVIDDFLRKRQQQYLQSSYNVQFQDPKIVKPVKSQRAGLERPQSQASLAQGAGIKSLRALSRNSSVRALNQKEQPLLLSEKGEDLNTGKQKQPETLNQQVNQKQEQQPVMLRAQTAQGSLRGSQVGLITPQTYVNTTIDQYFGKNTGVCVCCADSIKGQQDRVLSYKYPTSVGTMYKKDFHDLEHQHANHNHKQQFGRQQQFILDKEKRNVKIKFDPPMNTKSTFQSDFKPFLLRSVQNDDNDKRYFSNPLFIGSTTYGTTYANWGAKPFERAREIRKKPFNLHFQGNSNYQQNFNKSPDQRLPPEYIREYDEKFTKDMRMRNSKGEFGSLLQSPFLAKSTTHEAFKILYKTPVSKPINPIEELISSSNVPHVAQSEQMAQFVPKNKYTCPRHLQTIE